MDSRFGAFLAVVFGLLSAGQAGAGGSFKVELISGPSYGSNPGSASSATDDFFFGSSLQATAIRDFRWNLTGKFYGQVQDARHMALGIDKENALALVSVTRTWRGFQLTTLAIAASEFEPQFSKENYAVFEFGSSASFPISFSENFRITPSVTSIARMSDSADMARQEIAPSLLVEGGMFGGWLSLSADYAYRRYTYTLREDHYLAVAASFSRPVWAGPHGISADLAISARYEKNISNEVYQDYEGFAAGPAIRLTWSPKSK